MKYHVGLPGTLSRVSPGTLPRHSPLPMPLEHPVKSIRTPPGTFPAASLNPSLASPVPGGDFPHPPRLLSVSGSPWGMLEGKLGRGGVGVPGDYEMEGGGGVPGGCNGWNLKRASLLVAPGSCGGCGTPRCLPALTPPPSLPLSISVSCVCLSHYLPSVSLTVSLPYLSLSLSHFCISFIVSSSSPLPLWLHFI